VTPREGPLRAPVQDIRLSAFLVLLGFGTIAHVAQLAARQQLWIGTFLSYGERWSQVFPMWSPLVSRPAIAVLYGLMVALALALLLRPRLAITVPALAVAVAGVFVSPGRIANNYFMMLAAYFGCAGAWALTAALRRSGGEPAGEMVERSLITWLRHLMIITYFFAFFHKVNYGWLNVDSNDSTHFLTAFAQPVLSLTGAEVPRLLRVLAVLAIYGALSTELLLPFLLLARITRTAGAAIGLVFHLFMIGRGIINYPAVILAFYPLFFTHTEIRELWMERLRAVTLAKCCLAAVPAFYIGHVWRPLRRLAPAALIGKPLWAFETLVGYVAIIVGSYVLVALVAQLVGQLRHRRSTIGLEREALPAAPPAG